MSYIPLARSELDGRIADRAGRLAWEAHFIGDVFRIANLNRLKSKAQQRQLHPSAHKSLTGEGYRERLKDITARRQRYMDSFESNPRNVKRDVQGNPIYNSTDKELLPKSKKKLRKQIAMGELPE